MPYDDAPLDDREFASGNCPYCGQPIADALGEIELGSQLDQPSPSRAAARGS